MTETTEQVESGLVREHRISEEPGGPASRPPSPPPWRNWRIVLFALAALALLVLVVTAVSLIGRLHRPGAIEGSGTIQATQVDLAPKVSGRLERLLVLDGERVRSGQALAQLDRSDPSLEVRSAEANLAVARARVPQAEAALALAREQVTAGISQSSAGVAEARSRELQAGQSLAIGTVTASTQVDVAQAQRSAAQSALLASRQSLRGALGNAAAADASYERARADYARAARLAADGAIAAQQFDAARAAYLAAQGQRDAAHAQVGVAQSQARAAERGVDQARATLASAEANRGTVELRRLDVNASRAQAEQSQAALAAARAQRKLVVERARDVEVAAAALRQAQAALDLARLHLDETTLRAPFDGIALTHEAEVGDLVGVGMPVVTIADLDHPYIRVYVSESGLARVKLGQPVDVRVDGLPGRIISGRVSEISGQAEFTPSNVQTKEERVELVFGVKVTLPNPDGLLKPGLPADASIRGDVPSGG